MKGVYSNANDLYHTRLQQLLMAGSEYGHVSGGDPECIPLISHDDLVAYHRTCYSPANCRALVYSQQSVDDHLAYFDRVFAGVPETAVL